MRRRWDIDERGHGVADALGSFAEEMTYVRKHEARREVTGEIVTGVVSDGEFAPHGHTVRPRVRA